MRLVTLDSREVGGRPGVWLPDGDILDLAAAPGTMDGSRWLPQSTVSVLAQGAEGRLRIGKLAEYVAGAPEHNRAGWRRAGILVPFASTALLAPVRRPGLLLMTRPEGLPVAPDGLRESIKSPNTVTGPDSTVAMPDPRLDRLSASPMLGLVLGRELWSAGPEEAARALAAVTLLVDLGSTASGTGPNSGRQFPGACPMGPAFITLDDIPAGETSMVLRVNRHAVGRETVDIGSPNLPALLAAVSRHYALRPGDIVGYRAADLECPVGRGDSVALALGDLMELRFTVA